MVQKSKHRQIVEYVLNEILNGTYQAGDRLPSDAQLLRQFQTSRPTVAKAMKQLEKEGYIKRRVGAGSFVCVRAQTKPSLIGLLTPEIGEAELFEPLCSEIATQCQKNGLSLLWPDSSIHQQNLNENSVKELCQRFIAQEVAGVFFAPVEFDEQLIRVNHEVADSLHQAGISVVLLDRDLERMPDRSRYDWVGIDNFRAGFLQAEYFIKQGCQKVGYVARLSSAPTIDLRIAGFLHAMHMYGVDRSNSRVIFGDVKLKSFLNELKPAELDAVACSNDTTAIMLMNTLLESGISVPADLRIMGVDDVKMARHARVPLTTIHQPFRSIGRAAVDTMMTRMENRNMKPRDIFIDVEVVVRDSCGTNAPQNETERQ